MVAAGFLAAGFLTAFFEAAFFAAALFEAAFFAGAFLACAFLGAVVLELLAFFLAVEDLRRALAGALALFFLVCLLVEEVMGSQSWETSHGRPVMGSQCWGVSCWIGSLPLPAEGCLELRRVGASAASEGPSWLPIHSEALLT